MITQLICGILLFWFVLPIIAFFLMVVVFGTFYTILWLAHMFSVWRMK